MAIPRIFEGLPARFHGPNPSTRPDPPREFTPPANATPERIAVLKKQLREPQAELEKIPFNGVRVGQRRGRRAVLADRRRLRPRAGRASTSAATWTASTSRPARGGSSPTWRSARSGGRCRRAEIDQYVGLVKEAQQEEQSFDEGLAVGIAALLVSPDFLFRIERDRPLGPTRHVAPDHRSTSSRRALSYFLWASMPDDEPARAPPMPARCAIRWCSRAAGAPHAAGSAVAARWPRTSAASGCSSARSNRSPATAQRFPDFEDYLRAVDAPRDGAVRRARHPRGPQHPRLHRRPLLPSSTSGWRSTTASRTSPGRSSAASI